MCRSGPTIAARLALRAHVIRHDERGSIAVISALVLPVIAVMIGMIIDYDRVSKARFAYQTAIDETARLMTDRRRRSDDLGKAARGHFNARMTGAHGDVAVEVDRGQEGFRLSAKGRVTTPFMALARVPHVEVVARADVRW